MGFGEQAILRAALNGTREVLGELSGIQEQIEAGELIRARIRQELRTAMHLEARQMVQKRVQ